MKKMFNLKSWEIGLIAAIMLLLGGVAYSQYVYESITISYTPKTLTVATYKTGVQRAWITVEGNDIVFTVDGIQTPTSIGFDTPAVGHILSMGGEGRWLDKYEIKKFKAVRADYRGDALIKVTYY